MINDIQPDIKIFLNLIFLANCDLELVSWARVSRVVEQASNILDTNLHQRILEIGSWNWVSAHAQFDIQDVLAAKDFNFYF